MFSVRLGKSRVTRNFERARADSSKLVDLQHRTTCLPVLIDVMQEQRAQQLNIFFLRLWCGILRAVIRWLPALLIELFLVRVLMLQPNAETRKAAKYSSLAANYVFVPIAIETFGAVGLEASVSFSDLGRRLHYATHEPRDYTFLMQCSEATRHA